MYSVDNIFSKENIKNAWQLVKQKKSSGGIDNISVQKFEENLDQNLLEIYEEILSGMYIPEPYKRIFIEKVNKKDFRPIGLLTIKDKIIQTCVNEFYKVKLDKLFTNTSYAYRPGKGHLKAINRVQDFIQRGYKFFHNMDIDNFFDTIDREILFEKCRTYFLCDLVEKLIQMWVKIGFVYKGEYLDSKVGIAQGGVISPLLSNLYLNDLDHYLKNQNIINVRFADNILLFSKTIDELKDAINKTRDFLMNSLKLNINPNDVEIADIINGFTFCGVTFKEKKRFIDEKKFHSILQRIEDVITKTEAEQIPKELNYQLDSIRHHYLHLDTKEQIEKINSVTIEALANKFRSIRTKGTDIKDYKIKSILFAINFIIDKESDYSKGKIINYIIKKTAINFDDSKTNIEDINKITTKLINKRKRAYKKIWYSNVDVIINNDNSQVGTLNKKLVIKRKGSIINQIHIDKVKNVLISANSISISSNAIRLCSENNIKVDFFDELGKPYATLLSASGTAQPVQDYQIESKNNSKAKHIIIEIIKSKIKNQLNLMKYFFKNKTLNDDDKKLFNSEISNLITYINKLSELTFEMSLDEFREKAFGYEGIAAVSYWNLVKKLISIEFDFEHRERKNAENIVNKLLNYGYGILYSRVHLAVTLAGLNPNISFLHKEQQGKPTLIFDLIEIFRAPIVDRTVISILNRGIKVKEENNLLHKDTKAILSKKILLRLNTEINYRNKISTFNDLILEAARNLVDYLKGDIKTLKFFINKW